MYGMVEIKELLPTSIKNNICMAIKHFGTCRVIQVVGLDKIIDAVDLKRLIKAAGLEKVRSVLDKMVPSKKEIIVER